MDLLSGIETVCVAVVKGLRGEALHSQPNKKRVEPLEWELKECAHPARITQQQPIDITDFFDASIMVSPSKKRAQTRDYPIAAGLMDYYTTLTVHFKTSGFEDMERKGKGPFEYS